MKLSISNIAWEAADDKKVYSMMKEHGFTGLEIAPTRIFPQNPYDRLKEAGEWKDRLFEEYGFSIPSMQSIWYGRKENMFGSRKERRILADYTKKAAGFAHAVGCRNMVFGCPRSRNMPKDAGPDEAAVFFRELGSYAAGMGTVIGMEANPPVYHTNFINDTMSALELIGQAASDGFRLNLDVGTMAYNHEQAEQLRGKTSVISHVHISEPGLVPLQKRELHQELADILRKEGYDGFISIEMGKQQDLSILGEAMAYVKEVFG